MVRWTDTDISGVYRVVVGQHPRQHLFAVNVPAINEAQQLSESDLTRTDREDLQKTYPEWEVQVVTEPGQVKHATPGEGEPERLTLMPLGDGIARWLLLALLCLIVIEVGMAWRFGHYSAGVTPLEEGAPARTRTPARWALLVLPWLLFACVLGVAGILIHNEITSDFLALLPDSGGASSSALPTLRRRPPAKAAIGGWSIDLISGTTGPMCGWRRCWASDCSVFSPSPMRARAA